jgi:hypothetical protein
MIPFLQGGESRGHSVGPFQRGAGILCRHETSVLAFPFLFSMRIRGRTNAHAVLPPSVTEVSQLVRDRDDTGPMLSSMLMAAFMYR